MDGVSLLWQPPSTCDKRPFSPTVLSSPFQGVKRPSVDKQVQWPAFIAAERGCKTQSRVLAGFTLSPGLHQWKCVPLCSVPRTPSSFIKLFINIFILKDFYTRNVQLVNRNEKKKHVSFKGLWVCVNKHITVSATHWLKPYNCYELFHINIWILLSCVTDSTSSPMPARAMQSLSLEF